MPCYQPGQVDAAVVGARNEALKDDLVTGQEAALDGTGTGGWVGLRPAFPGYLREFTGGGVGLAVFGVVHFVNFVHGVRIAGKVSIGRVRVVELIHGRGFGE